MYRFHDELWLPRPRDEVFPFFADARNLGEITPPWVQFEILTPSPIAMCPGTLIDYRIRVHGFPIRWRTEITEWNPPFHFVDEQRSGPYSKWHHTHRFEEKDGGTLCIDDVIYRPHGGAIIHRLFVRRDVKRIFSYRREKLLEFFPPVSPEPSRATIAAR